MIGVARWQWLSLTIRELIRESHVGEQRIAGELRQKLGLRVSARAVGKYLRLCHRIHKHRLPSGYRVTSIPVLAGIHHLYGLASEAIHNRFRSEASGLVAIFIRITERTSLPADLDTAWRYAAATRGTGKHAATVRDDLYPKGAFALVVRVAGRAAQCIQAGLCRARGCGGVSR